MAEIPSGDPADLSDFTGAFRHIFGKMLQGVDGMLPARVISYNRTTNRATVQPLIMLLTTSNATIPRAQIGSVPVYQYGGGDFLLSFPVKAGDLGWIKANDRDISLFLQKYGQSAPNTIRKKSFSDAVFYPDVMRGYTIAGEDANNVVLQNLAGTVKVSLGASKVKITAPTVEIVSTDVIITSTTLKHNGINIGSTHIHPQGADSAGNTQQNTGVPQ